MVNPLSPDNMLLYYVKIILHHACIDYYLSWAYHNHCKYTQQMGQGQQGLIVGKMVGNTYYDDRHHKNSEWKADFIE